MLGISRAIDNAVQRPPRNALTGAQEGLYAVALGALGGGTYVHHATGSSLAACTAGACVGAAVGGMAGAVQVARGVVQTPFALAHRVRGHVWNSEKRCWEDPRQQRANRPRPQTGRDTYCAFRLETPGRPAAPTRPPCFLYFGGRGLSDPDTLLSDAGISAESLVELTLLPTAGTRRPPAAEGPLAIYVHAPTLGCPESVCVEVAPDTTAGQLAAAAAVALGLIAPGVRPPRSPRQVPTAARGGDAASRTPSTDAAPPSAADASSAAAAVAAAGPAGLAGSELAL
eukprot:TRINITY_DN388_c0_g1_i2.p1 TRINITY_DN388_c0_g1~~TRINITY_DN388_c0_g1_i2.p1  ORF type:complete len:285 (+),score=56.10 TRINITY_DN388_c0_g1_i2:79-933(+)